MKIQFMGHASIYIETDKVTIATDPWYSKTGAFVHSWYQFPDNTDLNLEHVRNADYIVLSHEHQDHFDIEFLKTINPKTKIIIPKYTDSYLYDELKKHIKNNVIVAHTQEVMQLGDVTFCPVVQSVPIWDDCTLIFKTPMGTIVDVNDMKITPQDLEWIKQRFDMDYFFIQFSGANWHPMIYDFSSEKKIEIARHKVHNKFLNVLQRFEASGAKWLIPCAGPPCFLDDEAYDLNFSRESVFPTQDKFYYFAKRNGLGEKTVVLAPGDSFANENELLQFNDVNLKKDFFVDRKTYLDAYKARRTGIIKEAMNKWEIPQGTLKDKANIYFKPLIGASAFFREHIGGKIRLDVVGAINEKLIVDFTNPENPVTYYDDDMYFYKFTVDARFLHAIFEDKLSWEQLLLSLRMKAARTPDIFNQELIVFLRFACPESYKAYELFENQKRFEETFDLEHDGETFTVQKYCPHAMGDLSKGQVIDGYLVCPNHGWKFSLKDGTCKHNKSCIHVKKCRRNI